jgi:hypothetical protein
MKVTFFPVNSYVLLGYPDSNIKKGLPNKFMTSWQGPYQVVKSVGNNYTILDLATMKEDTVNVHRLKEFLVGDEDPRQVANQATGRDDVERIVSHKGSPNFRKKMKFEVKWVGFEHTTWEPWSKELSHLHVMHDYLRANKIKMLIPAAFK